MSEPKASGQTSVSATRAEGVPCAARKTARDFHPDLLRLFDSYVHGLIDRRSFLESAAKFATGTTALALLGALNPRFAEAAQVSSADPRLRGEHVEIPSPDGYGKVRGYLVRSAKPGGKLPAVLVVHENRGLNPHIEDVTRRLALDNFLAFAPDALFPLGGYRATKTRRASSSASSTRRRRIRISWRARNGSSIIPRAMAGSAWWGSATAAASRISWPRGSRR